VKRQLHNHFVVDFQGFVGDLPFSAIPFSKIVADTRRSSVAMPTRETVAKNEHKLCPAHAN
jgi:hypothetical protein